MEHTKKLILEDTLKPIDQYIAETSNNVNILQGLCVFKDENGVELFRKHNTVVLRGRTFALEKMFNLTTNSASGYSPDLARAICLFKIGSGGTPPASPFTPLDVSALDTDLANPVPFRTMSSAQMTTFLSTPEGNSYKGRVDLNTQSSVFFKTFDSSSWVYDSSKAIIARKMSLAISSTDARGQLINELGLCIANENTFANTEIISRITFDTESMGVGTKSLLIDYYLYA